jgi:hypothetical protein
MRGSFSFNRGGLLSAVCALAVAGCTSNPIGSSYSTMKGTVLSGVPYSLPRVMLTAAVVRDADGISIEISDPTYGPDPSETYLLKYVPHASSKDKFNVGVDPATSLLTSLGAEAEDQTDEALIALAKTVGAVKFERAITGTGRQVLFAGTFDPTDVAGINTALSTVVSRDARAAVSMDCAAVARAATQEQRKGPEPMVCALARQWPAATYKLSVDYTAFAYGSGVTPASCEVGFCTRVLRPAVIRISDGAREIGSEAFNLPNKSAAVPVELRRAVFVKATHAITLRNGLVESSEVNKESETLAIANLPFEILKAIFAAPAELIQLKIDLSGKEKGLLEAEKDKLIAEKDKLAAEKALEDARKGVSDSSGGDAGGDTGKQESAVEGAQSDSSAQPSLLMKVVLPGLGRGSGAELAAGPQIGNDQESAITHGPPPPRNAQPQQPQANCPQGLEPCTGSSNGPAQ